MKAEYEKEKCSGVRYEPNAALLADYEQRAKERAAQAAIDAQQLEKTLADAALAAERAAVLMLENAKDAWTGEPYLERKKVAIWLFDGIRVATQKLTARLYSKTDDKWHAQSVLCEAGDILVPMCDAAGRIRNVQRIAPDGKKRPIMGAPVDELFFDVPGKLPFIAAEGVATGLSVAEATGRAVRVCFTASNISKVIAATGSDIQLIAADNDIKYDDDGGISESRSYTGEKVARATGLPWAMPPLLDGKSTDWNDFLVEAGVEETKREFERRIRESVAEKTLARREPSQPRPEFNPYKIAPYELKGSNLGTWLNALNAEPCAEKAAAMAWAICARRAKMVPVEHDVGQLVELVCRDTVAITDEMRAGIQARLTGWTDKRKARAMAAVSMPAAALKAHKHEVVSELPTLTPDDYRGVIVVKAPMAAGKTQKIGAPFAAWAKQQAGRFVATCHRRSLVAEMAVRLGVTHYSDVTAENAFGCSALATCLPSITKAAHASIYAECAWLFIDEVAQVLRFLEARDVCSTEDGTNADVYAKLKEIIKQAKCVIVADAGCDARTLRFLEECRPKEAFRVIDMQAPAKGLSISAAVGAKAQAAAFGEMLARCAEGERIWVGCESEKRVAVVSRWLRNSGIATLALTGENKGDDEQKAFWDNPEAESLKYQAVVHSPVISSGLSIEHREHGEHFSHGFFIGGGLAVTPADAAQMMRRVRYLKTWTLVLLHNNAAGISDADSLLDGMEDAAVVEGHNPRATSFDELCAQIKADDAGSRADFCAGLWWILESAGFGVARGYVDDEEDSTREVRDEVNAERAEAVISADTIDDEEAKRLRTLDGRTQAQSYELEQWRIRHALGIESVSGEDYEAWNDGRIVSKLDRYSAAAWGLIDEHDATDEHLSRKRWWVARRSAYRYLFDGLIDVSEGFELTREGATELVRRV
ncbi:MAG: plasmid replication protein, CyRepA1 family, partial [Pseudomonas sp.]